MSSFMRELFWAAGFLEGEGTFAGRCGSASARVAAAQAQLEPLERLRGLLGGDIWTVTVKPGLKPMWTWQESGPAAIGIMFTMYGLMSPRRREQIRRTITWWRSRPVYAKYRTECPKGHPLNRRPNRAGDKRQAKRYCLVCNRLRHRLPDDHPRARLERRVG
jgi:hypothetical protein